MKDIDPKELLELAGDNSLTKVVIYYWLGRWAEDKELQMFEEMMVLCVDHGDGSPSAKAVIEAAKSERDVLRGVEAGVRQIDSAHGGAIEHLAKILLDDSKSPAEIVAEHLEQGKRLPGFGHRIYKDQDPRSWQILNRARERGLAKKCVDRIEEFAGELEKQKGKLLPINIDGAMAAVLADMGVKPEMMNAFFLWPRVAGLVYRWGLSREG